MAKHFLTDEIIEHIQDGYYATHEQDLSEDQIHELSEEQLRYYTRQGKEYHAAQKKKHRLVIIGLIVGFVVVVGVVAALFVSFNGADDNLYDPNKQDSTTSQDTNTPGLVPANQSNTRAGAKDDAAQ